MPGTVWAFVEEAGFAADAFSWSGKNDDMDRRIAGASLAQRIRELAGATGATASAPLTLNLIAHSHGGNVVLEALRSMPEDVRIAGIVLLGTPLLSSQPTLRAVRLLIALVFLTPGLFAIPAMAFWLLGSVPVAVYLLMDEGISGAQLLLPLLLPVGLAAQLTVMIWVYYLCSNAADWCWRQIHKLVRTLSRRDPRPTYGPSPSMLLRQLAGHRILTIGSQFDEAGVLLSAFSAPGRLYDEASSHWTGWHKWANQIWLRPLMCGGILQVIEAMLERRGLGMSWRQIMLRDHEIITDPTRDPVYGPEVFEVLDDSQLGMLDRDAAEAALGREGGLVVLPPLLLSNGSSQSGEPLDIIALNLKARIVSVGKRLKGQLNLYHSLYYGSSLMVQRIADWLVAGSLVPAEPVSTTKHPW